MVYRAKEHRKSNLSETIGDRSIRGIWDDRPKSEPWG